MKINKICIGLFLYLGYTASLCAENNVYFDPDFLEMKGQNDNSVDLTQFENNEQLAGSYYVDIYINSNLIGAKKLYFDKNKAGRLIPCLAINELKEIGIKTIEYPELHNASRQCANLSAIPNANSDFDFDAQRLYLSIPQIAIDISPRGYVDLANIDDGIAALLLNYSYSGSKNFSRIDSTSDSYSQYVNLRPGINIGPWRLRNYTTWSSSSNQSNKWDTLYTYLSRNINSLKSQLTLGDSVSPSMVFDSVPFRGAQLATDDDMYPESLRGYAPVVRGIARSNAQITIRQNGYIIYQTDVAAGAFEIKDLYPTGSSGDLYVTIKESNGSEQVQIVPFASLPVLQREGYFSYSVTGGQYRAYDNNVDKKHFGQLTLMYGFPHGITAYGGSQLSDKYQAYSVGAGQNLGRFGALSIDITQTQASLSDDSKQRGQSYRFRYNKNLNDIGTNIALAGYRYSTKGFYSLSEVFNEYRNTEYSPMTERRRNRGEISLNQNLGEGYGSLSLGYVTEDYWNSARKTESIMLSYNNSWQSISYGLNYNLNQNTNQYTYDHGNNNRKEKDHVFGLSISVPFTLFESTNYVNMSANSSSRGNSSGTLGVSGSQLNNSLNWSAQQSFANQGQGGSGNINAAYKGQYGEVNAGNSYNKDNYNLYYGANGSLVAHSGGIVIGQQLGETAGLIEIPKASNVAIQNQAGVITNNQGYALVPYLTAYRKNTLDVNTSVLPDDTEMELTSQSVSPSRGALVKANFVANVGYRALIVLTFADGKSVPFGAQAIFSDNDALNGMVGSDGELYLSGLAEKGQFTIQYNDQKQCLVNYDLAQLPNYMGLYKAQGICQ
nr:fimbria/pilus outer membrane usher protein [uncultured Moellerella sp.]